MPILNPRSLIYQRVCNNLNAQLIKDRIAYGLKYGYTPNTQLRSHHSINNSALLLSERLSHRDLPALFLGSLVIDDLIDKLRSYIPRVKNFWNIPEDVGYLWVLPAYVDFVSSMPQSNGYLERHRANLIKPVSEGRDLPTGDLLALTLIKTCRDDIYSNIRMLEREGLTERLSKYGQHDVMLQALLFAVIGLHERASEIINIIMEHIDDTNAVEGVTLEPAFALAHSLVKKNHRNAKYNRYIKKIKTELESFREFPFWTGGGPEPEAQREDVQCDLNKIVVPGCSISSNNSDSLIGYLFVPEISGATLTELNIRACSVITEWYGSIPRRISRVKPTRTRNNFKNFPFHKLWPFGSKTCKISKFVKKWLELKVTERATIYRWIDKFHWKCDDTSVSEAEVRRTHQNS